MYSNVNHYYYGSGKQLIWFGWTPIASCSHLAMISIVGALLPERLIAHVQCVVLDKALLLLGLLI